MFKQWYFL